jgi:hypothetical protein
MTRRFTSLFMAFAALAAFGLASAPRTAGAEEVSIEVPNLRCIQTFTIGENKTDDVYFLVNGVAQGKAFDNRIPDKGTLKAAAKMMPISAKKNPQTLWKGDLADGEFAFVTVSLFQVNPDAKNPIKPYTDALVKALAGVEARSKKTLASKDEFKALAVDTHKAQKNLVVGIKKLLSRELGTDHYGGLFNILVWNHGGQIMKRLDPVGLTFGEHYGTDVKIYTKLKYTLDNVLYQDTNGEWFAYQLGPVSDDEFTIRPKCLETEVVMVNGKKVRNVTDYLFDVQVNVKGKAIRWELAGEMPGETIVHDYWNWAE